MDNFPPYLITRQKRQPISLDELGGDFDFITQMTQIFNYVPNHITANVVLILTRVNDPESDLIGLELCKRNIDYIRINADDVPTNLKFDAQFDGEKIVVRINSQMFSVELSQIKSVLYRHFDFEAFQPLHTDAVTVKYFYQEWEEFFGCLVSLTKAKWMNHPYNVIYTNKIQQLILARSIGFKVPQTLVSNNAKTIRNFTSSSRVIICKTLHSHYIEYNRKLYPLFGSIVDPNLGVDEKNASHIPAIYQEYINNSFEARVTVIGNRVFAAKILVENNSDWHNTKMKDISLIEFSLPKNIELKCIHFLEKSGLSYGAFDLLFTPQNECVFLEVNPLGDWRWVEQHTKQPITESIVEFLITGFGGNACGKEG